MRTVRYGPEPERRPVPVVTLLIGIVVGFLLVFAVGVLVAS